MVTGSVLESKIPTRIISRRPSSARGGPEESMGECVRLGVGSEWGEAVDRELSQKGRNKALSLETPL